MSRALAFLLKSNLVERIEHNELHGDFVRDIGLPLAIHFEVKVNVELNVVFNLIVLGVREAFANISYTPSISLLIVSKVRHTEHSGLLEVPVSQLATEIIIDRVLKGRA